MMYYAGKYGGGEVYFHNTGVGLKIFLKIGDNVMCETVTHLELQMSRVNLINLIVDEMSKEMVKNGIRV